MTSGGGGARAASTAGRGAQSYDARSPGGLSARSWGSVLRRVARHVLSDRLMVQSAGVAFFALLSIAPVLVTAISVYGAVNTPEQALAQLSDVTEMLPSELEPMVADQLTTITTASVVRADTSAGQRHPLSSRLKSYQTTKCSRYTDRPSRVRSNPCNCHSVRDGYRRA